jgi:hypothetical protein
MNFFDHKDLGYHLLQLCPKVVKHPVYWLLFDVFYVRVTVHRDVRVTVHRDVHVTVHRDVRVTVHRDVRVT